MSKNHLSLWESELWKSTKKVLLTTKLSFGKGLYVCWNMIEKLLSNGTEEIGVKQRSGGALQSSRRRRPAESNDRKTLFTFVTRPAVQASTNNPRGCAHVIDDAWEAERPATTWALTEQRAHEDLCGRRSTRVTNQTCQSTPTIIPTMNTRYYDYLYIIHSWHIWEALGPTQTCWSHGTLIDSFHTKEMLTFPNQSKTLWTQEA